MSKELRFLTDNVNLSNRNEVEYYANCGRDGGFRRSALRAAAQ
jgi:hypothetical protein